MKGLLDRFRHQCLDSGAIGNELMCRIERFAKRNPRVILSECDDWAFSTSLIALVPSLEHDPALDTITMMVIVPQSGDCVCKMFLYPENVRRLEQALRALRHQLK